MARRPDREETRLIAATLPRARLGPYQLQAAIAAVHAEAPSPEETDWPQVLALYELLERVAPNPMATLNRAVALAMVHGRTPGWTCSRRSKMTSASPATTA